MRLMLTRHGQTQSNVESRLDTRPPGRGLTPEGQRQALDLAERLADEPITAVYASQARRAQETAEPLAGKLGLAVEVLDGVTEISAGDLENSADLECYQRYYELCVSWTEGDLDASLPGGETGHEFRRRYLGALELLRQRHGDELVVLVSHGAAIRLAAGWVADNVSGTLSSASLLPNTGQVVLETTPTGWRCVSWPGVELR